MFLSTMLLFVTSVLEQAGRTPWSLFLKIYSGRVGGVVVGSRVSRTHSRILSNGQWPLKMKYCMIGDGMGCGGGC